MATLVFEIHILHFIICNFGFRNPDVPFRPKFVDISLELISDRKEVLGIPQEALESHKQAGFLGADLEAGEGMYQDLQNRYVIK